MRLKQLLALTLLAAMVVGCESGDINLTPTNIDNSTTTGGGGGGSTNPCASYTAGGATRQGTFDGTNCTYDANFVSEATPLTVNLRIPFISGVHIFQDSLIVGQNVTSGAAPAEGAGPTLVIDAGNTIAFSASNRYVLINRGSKIMAEGTAIAPITFTGFTDAVSGTAGPYDVQLWGGIVINGNGVTNNCTDGQRASNACHVQTEGRPSQYGGNVNTESSGVLRYVVVKHTGFELAPGDELNGVTFNTVGSGTIVENLEVYSTYDDGIEFFGGAVNITNFVALYVRDDSIDFSDGYSGTIRNALIIHAPQNSNNCIEGDGIASGRISGGAASTPPISKPTISHMTCITSNFDAGTHGQSRGPIIRFGARAIITDSIIEAGRGTQEGNGTSNVCWELDNASTPDTINAAAAGETTMNRTVINCQTPTATDPVNADTQTQWITNTGTGSYPFNTANAVITATFVEDPLVRVLTPGTYYSFDADTVAGQVTINGAAGAPIVLTPVPDNYIGAVQNAATDWTANWTYGLAAANRGVAPWWEM
jgi:hypothetical protein